MVSILKVTTKRLLTSLVSTEAHAADCLRILYSSTTALPNMIGTKKGVDVTIDAPV